MSEKPFTQPDVSALKAILGKRCPIKDQSWPGIQRKVNQRSNQVKPRLSRSEMQIVLLIIHAVVLKLAPDVLDGLFGRRERKWVVLPNGLRGYSQAREPRSERPKLQAQLRKLYEKPVGDVLYLWRDEDDERRLSEKPEHAAELLDIYNSPGLEFSSYLRIEVPQVKKRLATHLDYATKLLGERTINLFIYAMDALNASRGFMSKTDVRPDDFRILHAVQTCWTMINLCFCEVQWKSRRREGRKT